MLDYSQKIRPKIVYYYKCKRFYYFNILKLFFFAVNESGKYKTKKNM